MKEAKYHRLEGKESLIQAGLTDIFIGAILSRGNNCLPSNHKQFYKLIKAIQAGAITPYPESMRPVIAGVTFDDNAAYSNSPEIESTFANLTMEQKISIYINNSKAVQYYVADNDNVGDVRYEFFEKYQDDYETLEFFKKCGDYLAIEDK